MCSKIRKLLQAKPQRQHTPVYLAYKLLRIPPMVSLFCKAQGFLGILKGRTNNKKAIWSSSIQLLLLDPAIFDSEVFQKLYLEFEVISNDMAISLNYCIICYDGHQIHN